MGVKKEKNKKGWKVEIEKQNESLFKGVEIEG